jgi:Uma2 family endonuclease
MVTALQDITTPRRMQYGQAPNEVWRRRIVTLEEFAEIAAALPDEQLELINGEIEMAPPPDNFHIEKSDLLLELLIVHATEIAALDCQLSQSCWLAVPIEMQELWAREGVRGPSNVGPDVAIRYRDYLHTNRRPPALLVVEVISVSSQREIDRDLIRKPDIYATLEIPTYWVVDRRDKSVWVHTNPRDGHYAKREQCKGRRKLPAPGLDFLHITPARIFEA